MPASSPASDPHSAPPRWARFLDLICLILIVVAAQRLRLFSRRRKWFAVFPKGLAFNHSAAMKDEGSKTRRITVAISDLQSKAKKLREDLDQLEGKTPRKKRSKGKRSRT